MILRSNQLKTAQDIANGVKNLAIVLPALALLLFALAVYLARGTAPAGVANDAAGASS